MGKSKFENSGLENRKPNIHKLYHYFTDQLTINLNSLETLLAFDLKRKLSQKIYSEILHLNEEIQDLAMVHGYESIEAIADKIAATASDLQSEELPCIDQARQNMLSGIKAIRDILALTKSTDESPWELDFTIVNNFQAPVSQPGEVISAGNLADDKTLSDQDFFDIKELDSLMMSSPSSIGSPANFISSLKYRQRQNQDSTGEITEFIFDEIFREMSLEKLGLIQENLKVLRSKTAYRKAWSALKNTFSDLLELAQSYNVGPMREILILIDRICHDEMLEHGKPSNDLLELFARTELGIREFLEGFPESETILMEFSETLRQIFVSKPKLNRDSEKNQDLAAKSDETQPDINLAKNAEASSLREDNEDKIRKNWLLKKH